MGFWIFGGNRVFLMVFPRDFSWISGGFLRVGGFSWLFGGFEGILVLGFLGDLLKKNPGFGGFFQSENNCVFGKIGSSSFWVFFLNPPLSLVCQPFN